MDQSAMNHVRLPLDTLFEFYWRCYMLAREHEAETGCEIEGLDKLNEEVMAHLNNEMPEHPISPGHSPTKDTSTSSTFSCTSNQSERSTLSPETSSFHRSDNDGELVEVEDNSVELSSDSEHPMSDLEIEEDIVANRIQVKVTPTKDDEQSVEVKVKHESQRVDDLSLESKVNLNSESDDEGSVELSTAEQRTLDSWVNGQKQDLQDIVFYETTSNPPIKKSLRVIREEIFKNEKICPVCFISLTTRSSVIRHMPCHTNSVGDRGNEFLKPGFGKKFETILNKPIYKLNCQKSVKEIFEKQTKQSFG